MDFTMIDVTHIPEVAMENEVILFGRQKNESIPVEELASKLDTINYEIVSSITSRVPRIYISK